LLNKYQISEELNDQLTEEERHARHLINYDHVGWFNYCKFTTTDGVCLPGLFPYLAPLISLIQS
jgi:hypothetical protein